MSQRIQQRQVLETGASTYLQALAALTKFQREVYNRCKRALENRVGEMNESLGKQLDTSQINIHA